MSYFDEVDLGSSFQPIQSVQNLFGFVPNLFRAQSLLPRVIEAEAELAAAVLLKERALSRSQKEFIALVVAAAERNSYCFIGHHQTLGSLGIPEDKLNLLARDHHQAGLSGPDTVLLDFALKLTLSAPWVSGEDITVLRDNGLTDESILEAILVIGLTGFFCTLSTGL